MAALIIAKHQVSARPGARMVIAGLPEHLVQRLQTAGLDTQLTLAGTTDEAVAMLIPPA
jgi:hypothetical protein